jgi:hypothetical protein
VRGRRVLLRREAFVPDRSTTRVYAIDCAEAFGATCAETGGAIDCVTEVEEE